MRAGDVVSAATAPHPPQQECHRHSHLPLGPWLLLPEAPSNSINGLMIDTKYR
jgi:hypothetical protein